MKAPLPADEFNRLCDLRRLSTLDTSSEPSFDRLTRIAALLTGCPIALISLVDEDRQWFKSRLGLNATETSRDVSFCAHALLNDDLFVVLDASRDPRFFDNPLVTGEPGIRFYAGAPLKRPGGSALGTLCVIDSVPRNLFSDADAAILTELAAIVTELMEQRLTERKSEEKRLASERRDAFHRDLQDAVRQAQSLFISGESSDVVFGKLLQMLLRLTESRFGCIAAIEADEESGEYRVSPAQICAPVGDPGMSGMMHDVAIRKSAVVEHRRLAVPVFDGTALVAVIGLGGRESGYPTGIVNDLDPFLTSVAGLFAAARARSEGRRNILAIRLRDRALASINSAVSIVDPATPGGSILYCNAAFEVMSGFNAAEVTGKPFGLMHGPETDAAAIQAIEDAFRTGSDLDITLRDHHCDGSPFWHHISFSPVRNEDGRVEYFVTVGDDVTDKINAETELRRARDVAETNARLTSRFLANMSHEIRTPMNGVIGMTGLLLDSALSEEQRDFVETIRHSGEGLLTVINEILDFSRIDSGLLEIEKAPFDLTGCVEGAIDMVAATAARKGVDLEYLLDPGAPEEITGDESRLRQVLVNLLGNAIKFTTVGNVLLTVSGSRLADGKWEIHFAVKDTGIGVPAAKLDEIFKPFRQADNSTTRRYGGTGLGLAISKHLAEMMQGRMWVESKEGTGSTFHFTICAEARTSPETREHKAKRAALQGRRVLVIDPSPSSQSVLRQHLVAWGVQPWIYASPSSAALDPEKPGRFDLVIVDNDVPDLSVAGISRVAEDAPLIVLCSLGRRNTSLAEQLRGLQSPRFRLHSKPIKPSYLCDTLVSFLSGDQVPTLRKALPSLSTPEFAVEHPLTLLVVDDNPVNQKLVLLLLSKLGYDADTAGNGAEAVRAVQNRRYDVVFMDMHMPEMDGVEATRRIQELLPAGNRPWIIALTANAMQSDRDICLRAGMRDFVTKPVQSADLRKALLNVPVVDHNPAEWAIPDYLASLFDEEPETAADLLRIFIEDTTAQVGELEAALAAPGDRATKILHSLKGSAAQMGAMRLAGYCAAAEEGMESGARPLTPAAFSMLGEIHRNLIARVASRLLAVHRAGRGEAAD